MSQNTLTFADLLAPLTVEAFFADYHGKKPLHIKGAVGKFAGVCGWDTVSTLTSQAGIWTAASLELALSGKKIESSNYCLPGMDRDNRANQLVDLARVRSYLQQGASLVLNDVTTLAPGIAGIAAGLSEALKSRVQTNLYCSWQSYQGFGTHFDMHDVFAVHLEGRKVWNLYGKHFDNPIPHPSFRGLGAEFHKAHRGEITAVVTLEPGDVLYIPRGWYHDALAQSEATMHLSFGTTAAIGLDVISHLFDSAITSATLRADLPLDNAELAPALQRIAAELASAITSDDFLKKMTAVQNAQRPLLGAINLPGDAVPRYTVGSKALTVFELAGKWHLGTKTKSAPLPVGFEEPVRWILKTTQFAEADLMQAFPAMTEPKRRELLADLQAMKVLSAA